MTTSTGHFTETMVEVAQTQLYLLNGGTGSPLLVLHGVEGHEGWLSVHEALAQQATVYAPAHPGFAQTERPPWIETVAHQALFYHWFLQESGLQGIDLIGVGVGGWIAAQMAVMCQATLRHLILVDAAGVRPRQGEVADIFIIPWREMVERSLYDAKHCAEAERIYTAAPLQEFGGMREAGRSMAMRMCYRPYMYDPALLPTLGKIRVPTLVVWGAQDQIIPIDCGHLYQQAIPGAALRVIDRCGHWAHFEQPQTLAEIIREFIAA
jgi:pimeloyl-ACP methyl ester carboxylesterase